MERTISDDCIKSKKSKFDSKKIDGSISNGKIDNVKNDNNLSRKSSAVAFF
jgi:hypothetical protein